jgi:anti-anti-sigma factor
VPIGDVDLATVPLIRREIGAGRNRYSTLVLDLRQTTFMDFAGLLLLLQCDAAARADGFAFSLVAGSPQVQRLFMIVGVLDRLRFVSDDLVS